MATRPATRQRPSTPAGFTLGGLFLLTGLIGTLVALATPAIRAAVIGQASPLLLIGVSGFGSVVGSAVGLSVGLYTRRPLETVLYYIPIAALVGLLAGPIALVSTDEFPALLFIAFAGSVMMLIAGAILHRYSESHDDEWVAEEVTDAEVVPAEEAE